MRAAGDGPDGARLCALIVILWRAGLRISEALDLAETDLDRPRGAVLVRRGKGGKRREVGMDRWAWDQLQPWLEIRRHVADRRAVLRDPRSNCWEALGALSRPQATPTHAALPASVAGSPRTNSATPTRSRWPTRECRWSLSNANSVTPTSESHRSTSKASTARRSSTPSTQGPHR